MEIYAFRLFGYSFLSLSAFWWKSSYFCFSVLPTLRTFAGILVRTCLNKRIHMSYEDRFWEILRQKAFSHSGRLFFFGLLRRRRVMIRPFCQLCSNYLLFCMYSETGRGFFYVYGYCLICPFAKQKRNSVQTLCRKRIFRKLFSRSALWQMRSRAENGHTIWNLRISFPLSE